MTKMLSTESIFSPLVLLAFLMPTVNAADHSLPEHEEWHKGIELYPRSVTLKRPSGEGASNVEARTDSQQATPQVSVSSQALRRNRSSALASYSGQSFPTYQVLDLGTLGGNDSGGLDINDAGQVTGGSTTANEVGSSSHAFLYQDGMMLDIGTLGGSSSEGVAINNAGQITGQAYVADGTHAFLYGDGLMTDLGVVTGLYSSGTAINSSGQVTGVSTVPDGEYHAMLYTAENGMLDLGTLGDSYSRGDAINDAGEVIGIYQREYESYAFLYSNGSVIDLTPATPSYISPTSKSINATGHVAGSYRPSGFERAFVYRDGAVIDLGALGGDLSAGFAINDTSQVTGGATTADGESHAFLSTPNTPMQDLGTLGGTYSIGYAINNKGLVAGVSTTEAGELRAFVYKDGTMVDLGLEYPLVAAINEFGQVTGSYQLTIDGELHFRGFIATPISLLFSRLIDKAKGIDHGTLAVLAARVAQYFYAAHNLRATCRVLETLTPESNARTAGRHSSRIAPEVIADAKAIEAALECQ